MTWELVAIVLTALGTGGLLAELLKRFFSRQDSATAKESQVQIRQIDDRAALTRELWDRIEALEKRVTDLQSQVDSWREQYHQRGRQILKLESEVARLDDLLNRSMQLREEG